MHILTQISSVLFFYRYILITMAAAVLSLLFCTTGPFQCKSFLFQCNTGYFMATIIKRKVVRYEIIVFYCSKKGTLKQYTIIRLEIWVVHRYDIIHS